MDEAASGVVSVLSPDLQRDFAVDYTTMAIGLFVAPTCVATLVEPPLMMLADRHRRKWFVCGGLFVMGAASVLAGLASQFGLFVVALTVWFVANGTGVGAAQATVVEAERDAPEGTMLRWVFMGTLGDLAAPIFCAAVGAIGWGWRGAFVAAGAATMAYAILLATLRFPETKRQDDEAPEPTMRQSLRRAFQNRWLLAWLTGSWLCCMLDELLVVFGSLHLRDALGATLAERSVVLVCFEIGGLVGLKLSQRALVGRSPTRVLGISAGLCIACYAAWLSAPTIEIAAALALVVGGVIAPLYPLAQAQCFRTLPGEPGTVQALGVIFTPLDLALPFVLGLLADSFGPLAALCVLMSQPVGLFILAAIAGQNVRDGDRS